MTIGKLNQLTINALGVGIAIFGNNIANFGNSVAFFWKQHRNFWKQELDEHGYISKLDHLKALGVCDIYHHLIKFAEPT